MKKIAGYFIILFFGMNGVLSSCVNDELDEKSIFDTDPVERNEFDTWLLYNYVYPYNIQVKYRFDTYEADRQYNVVPADYATSVRMAKIVKHLWIESYEEVAGLDFIRANAPRILHFIGSLQYNPQEGTVTLGVAEGGIKITLTFVNSLDATNLDMMNYYYFNTMHHEFAHILQQKNPPPTEFNEFSSRYYSPTTWFNRGDYPEVYTSMGFVSAYAGSEPNEDFVEVIARYLTMTQATWDAILAAGDGYADSAATMTGKEIILRKLELVREYMRVIWGVDLDRLREVVRRRSAELPYLDLEDITVN
ncbi:hypothetical protein EZS27_008939 [termite gut metagenome]|uniref:Substrate import-associated zinc metallohydrolase lipoprotein n=1 Tax=termite gut metagenome TaxID=433724 RepID=A0A5J4SBB8_9ZZZZ